MSTAGYPPLLWTDQKFIGLAQNVHEARSIASEQEPDVAVDVCDFDATSPDSQFAVDPGSGVRIIGRLGWENCLHGLDLAAVALSDDVISKRDATLQLLENITNQQEIANQHSPEWQAWRQATEAFETAKALHMAFCERYGALARPYLQAERFRPFDDDIPRPAR